MSTAEDRLGNIEQALATLIDRVTGLEEKMLWGFESMGKTPPTQPAEAKPLGGTEDNTLLEALKEAGLDPSAIEIDPVTGDISPVKFLGDLWVAYMDVLKNYGFQWVKAGKESRWSRKSGGVSAPTQAVSSAPASSADSVEGTVKYEPKERAVLVKGESKKVTDFTLSTPSGDVRVSVWGAMVPPQVAKGKTVKVSGVKKGQPYKGVDQWSGGDKTTYIIR
jgi:hypothetical protein